MKTKLEFGIKAMEKFLAFLIGLNNCLEMF